MPIKRILLVAGAIMAACCAVSAAPARAIPRDAAGTIVTLPCMATPSCSHPKAIFGPWNPRRRGAAPDLRLRRRIHGADFGRRAQRCIRRPNTRDQRCLYACPLAGGIPERAPGMGTRVPVALGARWPPDGEHQPLLHAA